jgi:hypothetical protein
MEFICISRCIDQIFDPLLKEKAIGGFFRLMWFCFVWVSGTICGDFTTNNLAKGTAPYNCTKISQTAKLHMTRR